jgi:hypothetical protein
VNLCNIGDHQSWATSIRSISMQCKTQKSRCPTRSQIYLFFMNLDVGGTITYWFGEVAGHPVGARTETDERSQLGAMRLISIKRAADRDPDAAPFREHWALTENKFKRPHTYTYVPHGDKLKIY